MDALTYSIDDASGGGEGRHRENLQLRPLNSTRTIRVMLIIGTKIRTEFQKVHIWFRLLKRVDLEKYKLGIIS